MTNLNKTKEQVRNVIDVGNGFASEALRTLCLAYKDKMNPSMETIFYAMILHW